MSIEYWRQRIDELDRELVRLLNERAKAAQAIGRLKRSTSMPIYEPDRERTIFTNIVSANEGPLRDNDLLVIYQALIAVMREIQSREALDAGTNNEEPK